MNGQQFYGYGAPVRPAPVRKPGTIMSGIMFTVAMLAIIVLQVGLGVVLAMLAGLYVGAQMAATGQTSFDEEYLTQLIAERVEQLASSPAIVWTAQAGLYLLMLLGVYLIARRFNYGKLLSDEPGTPKFTVRTVFKGLLLGACMFCGFLWINAVYATVLDAMGYSNEFDIPSLTDPGNIAGALIGVVLFPAFIEEIVYRGVILRGLKPLGAVRAAFISAGMFALMHMNWGQLLNAFMAGLFFALVVIKTGNVKLAVFAHLANNLIAVIIQMLSDNFFTTEAELEQLLMSNPVISGAFIGVLLAGTAGLVLFIVNLFRSPNAGGWTDKPVNPQEQFNTAMQSFDPFDTQASLYPPLQAQTQPPVLWRGLLYALPGAMVFVIMLLVDLANFGPPA